MGSLLVLLLFASLHSISAHQKRGIVETNYHPSQHNIQIPQYYTKDPSTPVQDASKSTPVIVSLHPSSLSNYQQQFPTVPRPVEYQASAQVPYSVPHGFVPYSNQYIVNQPYQPQTGNLYIPFNQYQQLPVNLNADFTKNVPTNIKIHQPIGSIGPKIGSVKATPLYQHQIYHPLHTNVQHGNLGNLKYQHGPQTFQKQNLSPPTPPKIYRNFHPMVPNTPAPIQHPVPVKNVPQETEEQESNEEINEEEEEENERIEDEDHEDQQEQQEEDGEEHFRPEKFFSGRFHHDDDEDTGRYRTHEDTGRYRTHEDEEDHEDRYSESRPSKQSSKYPQKKYTYKKNFSPFKADPDFESFRGFKDPKVEIKMYKYSKSSKNPERKEYIEGKGSENVPVVHHSQKSYKEQWIISSESSSMLNE